MTAQPDAAGWLAERAALDPERVALEFGDSRVRYGELYREACVLAAELAGLGVGSGDVVATLVDDG